MNNKGTGMNVIVKILLIVAGLITIFSGANNIWISTGKDSLVRLISFNTASTMKALYALTGIASLVTSIVLAIKIFKK